MGNVSVHDPDKYARGPSVMKFQPRLTIIFILTWVQYSKLQPLVSAFSSADPDLDPHHFGNSDPDPQQSKKSDPDTHRSQKQDPDPHQSPNSGALEAQNGAMEAHPGAVEAQNSDVEALNGEMEAHNGASEGLKASCCRYDSLWWGTWSGSASKWKVGTGSAPK